ncbi:hypothetical protein ACFLY7_00120 [Patescibacteria group bacterium]
MEAFNLGNIFGGKKEEPKIKKIEAVEKQPEVPAEAKKILGFDTRKVEAVVSAIPGMGKSILKSVLGLKTWDSYKEYSKLEKIKTSLDKGLSIEGSQEMLSSIIETLGERHSRFSKAEAEDSFSEKLETLRGKTSELSKEEHLEMRQSIATLLKGNRTDRAETKEKYLNEVQKNTDVYQKKREFQKDAIDSALVAGGVVTAVSTGGLSAALSGVFTFSKARVISSAVFDYFNKKAELKRAGDEDAKSFSDVLYRGIKDTFKGVTTKGERLKSVGNIAKYSMLGSYIAATDIPDLLIGEAYGGGTTGEDIPDTLKSDLEADSVLKPDVVKEINEEIKPMLNSGANKFFEIPREDIATLDTDPEKGAAIMDSLSEMGEITAQLEMSPEIMLSDITFSDFEDFYKNISANPEELTEFKNLASEELKIKAIKDYINAEIEKFIKDIVQIEKPEFNRTEDVETVAEETPEAKITPQDSFDEQMISESTTTPEVVPEPETIPAVDTDLDTYEISKGDTLWKIIGDMDIMSEFTKEGQQSNAIANVIKKISEDPTIIGLEEDQSIHELKVGQEIDLDKIKNIINELKIDTESVIDHAENLSPETIEKIEANNDLISNVVEDSRFEGRLDEEVVDEILKSGGVDNYFAPSEEIADLTSPIDKTLETTDPVGSLAKEGVDLMKTMGFSDVGGGTELDTLNVETPERITSQEFSDEMTGTKRTTEEIAEDIKKAEVEIENYIDKLDKEAAEKVSREAARDFDEVMIEESKAIPTEEVETEGGSETPDEKIEIPEDSGVTMEKVNKVATEYNIELTEKELGLIKKDFLNILSKDEQKLTQQLDYINELLLDPYASDSDKYSNLVGNYKSVIEIDTKGILDVEGLDIHDLDSAVPFIKNIDLDSNPDFAKSFFKLISLISSGERTTETLSDLIEGVSYNAVALRDLGIVTELDYAKVIEFEMEGLDSNKISIKLLDNGTFIFGENESEQLTADNFNKVLNYLKTGVLPSK